MQMQQQQAELESSLQQKQLQVSTAAELYQPIIANLEKVFTHTLHDNTIQIEHGKHIKTGDVHLHIFLQLSVQHTVDCALYTDAAPVTGVLADKVPVQVHNASKLWAARAPLQAS